MEENNNDLGEGVPKIKIPAEILEAALRGNAGSWKATFQISKCEAPNTEFFNSQEK